MDRVVVDSIPEVLARYLATRVPGIGDVRVRGVERSPGGSSRAMYFVDAEWSGAAPLSRTLALRMDESSTFREPEISLLREYRVYRALQGTAVPVVENYFYEDDPSWFGQPFVVRERIDDVHTSLDGASEPDRHAVLEAFVEIIAAQHCLDWRALGLDFLGVPASPEAFPGELLEKWVRVFRRDQRGPDPLTVAGIAALRREVPTTVDRLVLLQGQVGPNQILWRDRKILASLDWESAMIGDPMADLAYFALACRGQVTDGYIEHLLDRYEQLTGTAVRRESFEFYSRVQLFWSSVVATTALNYAATRVPYRLEPLRAATVRTRGFLRRFEHMVTEL